MANGYTGFTAAWNNMLATKLTTLEAPGTPEYVPTSTVISQQAGIAAPSTHTTVAAAHLAMGASQEAGVLSGAPMAQDPTLQTLRASGGLTMPQELKQYLPLILVFALFVIILFKK